jgi:hypothetical protein
MRNTFLIIILAIIVSSCYNDRRENLNPQLPSNDSTSVCDTTNVSYTKDIQPILSLYCTNCHSSQTHTLNSFDDAKVEGDKIITRITTTGSLAMPQNSASLSTCKINKFKAWKNQGYK